ncbi:hypothetical protein LCGC14_0811820 [marine sediment metagenome]|uniref:Zinc-ribbon domain-containing protein n=1 Tax=marine sediment metagenome TaxID=412755 RepID=A0A0F9S6D4_9ZZZZ
MFCPSCGSELTEPNQSFCSKCGSKIEATLEIPEIKTKIPRQISINTSHSTLESTYLPISQQKSVKKEGRPGPYSKKCFGFALASIGLAIAGLSVGSGSMMFSMMSGFGNVLNGFGFLPGLIIAIVLNIIGLIFGILSRVNSSKARELEPVNTLEKIGSVFAIFGIISNAILIAVALIIAPVRFFLRNSFSPWDSYF